MLVPTQSRSPSLISLHKRLHASTCPKSAQSFYKDNLKICRLDEVDVKTAGVRLSPTSSGRPWRSNNAPTSRAVDYLNAANDHIFNGSKLGRIRKPFISATRDLRTALSWSYGGCHKIVKINLNKCQEAGVCVLDMGGKHNLWCWGGTVANFAAMSREVLLDAPIPADCCTLVKASADASCFSR